MFGVSLFDSSIHFLGLSFDWLMLTFPSFLPCLYVCMSTCLSLQYITQLTASRDELQAATKKKDSECDDLLRIYKSTLLERDALQAKYDALVLARPQDNLAEEVGMPQLTYLLTYLLYFLIYLFVCLLALIYKPSNPLT